MKASGSDRDRDRISGQVQGLGPGQPTASATPKKSGQISVVVFVGAYHDQLEVVLGDTIGYKILSRVDLEFVDEDTLEITLLLLPDRGILEYRANLIVKNRFLPLVELPHSFFEDS